MNAKAALAAGLLGATIGVAALLGFLPSARAAATAVTVRVDVFPDQPRVGDVATVQLRPFGLSERTPPALQPKNFPWRVAAISPSGRSQRIRMIREPTNPYLWTGTIWFPSPGSWQVCVLNFSSTGRACVPPSPGWRRVRVQERRASVDVWRRLQRPLRVPTIVGGKPCPTTPPDPKGDLTRIDRGLIGIAWGRGPAYPGALHAEQGKPTLRYLDPIPPRSLFHGSKWFGQKVVWVIDPAYRGPVLVRGRQLDGPTELRFDRGVVPPREMRFAPSPPPRGRPSFTRIRAPGCYAYQVDGIGLSYVIVFEAKPY